MSDLYELAAELADHYTEGEATGPGLIVQLRAALGDRRRTSPAREGSNPNKPGSRPPGWRADVSELLDDIINRTHRYWNNAGYTTPHDLGKAIRLLPEIVKDEASLADDLNEWRRLARLTLAYQIPSVSLPDVVCQQVRWAAGGRYTVGCSQPTLRIAEDMSSEVWCSNPHCHDNDKHPDCGQLDDNGYPAELGYGTPGEQPWPACRRTERDRRHNIRWTRDQIARMTADLEPELENA